MRFVEVGFEGTPIQPFLKFHKLFRHKPESRTPGSFLRGKRPDGAIQRNSLGRARDFGIQFGRLPASEDLLGIQTSFPWVVKSSF